MITLIAGSRTLGYAQVRIAMTRCGWVPTKVISGTAPGVDKSGEKWAAERHIPVERMPADWDKYGKQAGYLRNVEMDGVSKGTKHMIGIAQALGLRLFVLKVRPSVLKSWASATTGRQKG